MPLQIAIWTLMLVALLGPHTQWSVCLTGKCTTRVEAATACSGCCQGGVASEDRGTGDGENGGDCCAGCCIDLAMVIDEGPLPRPVVAPATDHEHEVIAVLPAPATDTSSAVAARLLGHDTGPPRVDRTTALIATTILRE